MKFPQKTMLRALAGAYIVYIVALIWNVSQYLTYRADVINHYTTLGFPIPSYDPFLLWNHSAWLVGIGFGLVSITVIVASARMSKRKAALSLTAMVILAVGSVAMVPVIRTPLGIVAAIQGDKPLFVNTLLYFDEEMAGDESARFSMAADLFLPVPMAQNPAWKFKEQVGVEFRWLNGFDFYDPDDPDYRTRYEYWDSKDSEHCCYDMLQEAIRERGGVYDPVNEWWVISENMMYQVNETHTEIVDFVFFCTGQEMDYRGLSPPPWRATIIQWGLTPSLRSALVLHELSHQFNMGHCPGLCLMNPDLGYYVGTWCTGCFNDLYDNKKYRFGYKSWVCIEESNPDGGHTIPAEWHNYDVRDGDFTIEAVPDPTYEFEWWTVCNETVCLLLPDPTVNPLTLPISEDWTIMAWWEPLIPITITNNPHGHTDPTAGTYYVSEGSTFTITAYADEGYEISTWTVTESPPRTICGNQNPLHYEVGDAVTITPNFSESGSGSSGGSERRMLLLR